MKLNLKRPIVFLDLETTGVDPAKDRIVEISLVKVMPDGTQEVKTRRLNPEMHIPEAASAVHGIHDEDVADCPTFREISKSLWSYISGCDFAGYNSNKFDIPVLVEEFLRAGVDVDMDKCRFIDVQNIFHRMEQRTLVAAYKFYCGKILHRPIQLKPILWQLMRCSKRSWTDTMSCKMMSNFYRNFRPVRRMSISLDELFMMTKELRFSILANIKVVQLQRFSERNRATMLG